jgi:hypothetical protein
MGYKNFSPVYVKSSGGIAVSRFLSSQKILIYSVLDSLKAVGRNSGINFPTVFPIQEFYKNIS